ncbi:MAG: hypothetical protein ACRC7N_21280 [Clostridium sp.]
MDDKAKVKQAKVKLNSMYGIKSQQFIIPRRCEEEKIIKEGCIKQSLGEV